MSQVASGPALVDAAQGADLLVSAPEGTAHSPGYCILDQSSLHCATHDALPVLCTPTVAWPRSHRTEPSPTSDCVVAAIDGSAASSGAALWAAARPGSRPDSGGGWRGTGQPSPDGNRRVPTTSTTLRETLGAPRRHGPQRCELPFPPLRFWPPSSMVRQDARCWRPPAGRISSCGEPRPRRGHREVARFGE